MAENSFSQCHFEDSDGTRCSEWFNSADDPKTHLCLDHREIENPTLCILHLHRVRSKGAFCKKCANCTICHKPLTVIEYEWCLRQAEKFEDVPKFEHPGCFNELEKLSLSSETVTIPRTLYDKLNACRLLISPIPELNPKTNIQDAEIHTQRWIHQMPFEEIAIAMKRAEAIAVMMRLALGSRLREVESTFAERDKEAFRKAREVREKSKDLAPNTHARVERKQLTKEDKAIAALVALGLSDADARESIKRKTVN